MKSIYALVDDELIGSNRNLYITHREIKEERKSGNISGEIRIGQKRP